MRPRRRCRHRGGLAGPFDGRIGGRWVAAAGEDGPLRIHAIPSGELLARAEAPERCTSIAVSPSGHKLAGGCDDEIRIWDVDAVLAVEP